MSTAEITMEDGTILTHLAQFGNRSSDSGKLIGMLTNDFTRAVGKTLINPKQPLGNPLAGAFAMRLLLQAGRSQDASILADALQRAEKPRRAPVRKRPATTESECVPALV